MFNASNNAVIDDGAKIGAETEIGHFAHVASTAEVGGQCTIGQGVFVGADVVLGDRVRLENQVSVFEGATLGSDVHCGAGVVFTGADQVEQTSFVSEPFNSVVSDSRHSPTEVGEGAKIGANATIAHGIQIGAWSMISPGTLLSKDVPAHALFAGIPAQQIGWVCKCGERMEFIATTIQCEKCQRRFEIHGQDVTECE